MKNVKKKIAINSVAHYEKAVKIKFYLIAAKASSILSGI